VENIILRELRKYRIGNELKKGRIFIDNYERREGNSSLKILIEYSVLSLFVILTKTSKNAIAEIQHCLKQSLA
jgi:hypothetical protein